MQVIKYYKLTSRTANGLFMSQLVWSRVFDDHFLIQPRIFHSFSHLLDFYNRIIKILYSFENILVQ